MDGFQGLICYRYFTVFRIGAREKAPYPEPNYSDSPNRSLTRSATAFRSFLLIWTVCLYGQCGALHRGQHHQRQDALAVNLFFMTDLNVACEPRTNIGQFGSGPGVQSCLVNDGHFRFKHRGLTSPVRGVLLVHWRVFQQIPVKGARINTLIGADHRCTPRLW